MEHVSLFNVSKRRISIPLMHQEVCVKIGRCLCDHETGAPETIHLIPGVRYVRKGGDVLLASELKKAVDRGDVKVYEKHLRKPEPVGNEKKSGKSEHKKPKDARAAKED